MADMEKLYTERLKRYVTAMRNEKPDRVPIRPFVAEFTAKYCGYTSHEVSYDYEKAFAAARKCAADFDWDAVVGNMVYGWMGLVHAIGLKYYAVPGVDIPPDTGFQYIEPPEDQAWMQADEYDQLIEDPTGYLFNVWLPRVSGDVSPIGQPSTFRNNMSFLRGGMAMLTYFGGFGTQAARLRAESGTVSAISGILKAPFDIIADKLRGYKGLCVDMYRQPDKLLQAMEALTPMFIQLGVDAAKRGGNPLIFMPLHKGADGFLSDEQFKKFYWPTLRKVIMGLVDEGCVPFIWAEGGYNSRLEVIRDLPKGKTAWLFDLTDMAKAKKALSGIACVAGNMPMDLLTVGTPQEARDHAKKLIDTCGKGGGYIMANGAFFDEVRWENLKAIVDTVKEYGVYK